MDEATQELSFDDDGEGRPLYGELVVVEDTAQVLRVPLAGGPVLVGRTMVESLPALQSAKSVSGRHAEVEERKNVFWLTDLASRNGTTVGPHGRKDPRLVPREPFALRDGDFVTFGSVACRFRVVYSHPVRVDPPTPPLLSPLSTPPEPVVDDDGGAGFGVIDDDETLSNHDDPPDEPRTPAKVDVRALEQLSTLGASTQELHAGTQGAKGSVPESLPESLGPQRMDVDPKIAPSLAAAAQATAASLAAKVSAAGNAEGDATLPLALLGVTNEDDDATENDDPTNGPAPKDGLLVPPSDAMMDGPTLPLGDEDEMHLMKAEMERDPSASERSGPESDDDGCALFPPEKGTKRAEPENEDPAEPEPEAKRARNDADAPANGSPLKRKRDDDDDQDADADVDADFELDLDGVDADDAADGDGADAAAAAAAPAAASADDDEDDDRDAPTAQWFWKDNRGWHPYPAAVIARVEEALTKGEGTCDLDTTRYLDFASMRQVRADDPTRRRHVKREPPIPDAGDAPPNHKYSTRRSGRAPSYTGL